MSVIMVMALYFLPFQAFPVGKSVELRTSVSGNMIPLPFFFISDNQFHNYLTDETILRNKLVDKLVRVAIRPPLQDLFADDLFLWTMEKFTRNQYVIMLGDALNISCQNEWERFKRAINPGVPGNRLHKGWLMAPGNHDSFYFGNSLGVSLMDASPVLKSWVEACSSSYPPPKRPDPKEVIITKDSFIKRYYKELLAQGRENFVDFPQVKNVDCYFNANRTKNVWYEKGTAMAICDWKNGNPNGLLQKFRLTYPQREDISISYRSYIVQEFNLTKMINSDFKIKGILLDTSDYKAAPSLLTGAIRGGSIHFPGYATNAGVNGSLGLDQVETIKRWIKENDPDTYYIFMGHHHYDSLDKVSKKDLNEILKSTPNAIYISAHTHEGFLKDHGLLKEINLGSITDYPNEVMTLGVEPPTIKNGEKIVFGVNKIPVTIEEFLKQGLCPPEENADKNPDPYYQYLSYKKTVGIGTPNQIFELTMDNNLMGLYKAFKKVGLYNNTKDPILLKLEKRVTTPSKKCGTPIGKENIQCRKEKVDLFVEALNINQNLYNSPQIRSSRIQFGACQTLWAAKAEKPPKKK